VERKTTLLCGHAVKTNPVGGIRVGTYIRGAEADEAFQRLPQDGRGEIGGHLNFAGEKKRAFRLQGGVGLLHNLTPQFFA
jgi:hypothetical protein